MGDVEVEEVCLEIAAKGELLDELVGVVDISVVEGEVSFGSFLVVMFWHGFVEVDVVVCLISGFFWQVSVGISSLAFSGKRLCVCVCVSVCISVNMGWQGEDVSGKGREGDFVVYVCVVCAHNGFRCGQSCSFPCHFAQLAQAAAGDCE